METAFNTVPESEKSETLPVEVVPEINDPDAQQPHDSKKRVKHEDHHVNRKYKLFSNHSSYGDSPHTNTSF
ncbi:hypothetical protein FLLO111716_02830 [Flavobacterium longum]|uniref:hypothetical protein n=1 Tax=Flavobacterium longum TaxID=1299340 RepID=UPI0039E91460